MVVVVVREMLDGWDERWLCLGAPGERTNAATPGRDWSSRQLRNPPFPFPFLPPTLLYAVFTSTQHQSQPMSHTTVFLTAQSLHLQYLLSFARRCPPLVTQPWFVPPTDLCTTNNNNNTKYITEFYYRTQCHPPLCKARPSQRGQVRDRLVRGAVAENAGTRPSSRRRGLPNDVPDHCCLIIVACRSSRSELMQCTPSHDSSRFELITCIHKGVCRLVRLCRHATAYINMDNSPCLPT
jgi:hypothetical protein